MMNKLIEIFADLFTDHWTKVAAGAVLMALGGIFGWWRARRKWQRKEFFERINFSLNSLQDGKLRIRTIMEKACAEVFLNQIAVSRLLEAAMKTTPDDPIIPLPKEEYWFYLNSVLNEVSEKFALGFIQRDVGHKVESHQYVICLTNEADGSIRTRKIRAMLIRAEDLKKLPEEMPQLESKNHETRWRTLQLMSARYANTPHQFFQLELVL